MQGIRNEIYRPVKKEKGMKEMKILKGTAILTAAAVILGGAAFCGLPAVTGADLTVNAAQPLTLNKTQLSMGKGEGYQLKANQNVKWRTSAPKILKVDQNGNVTAIDNGIAWITGRTDDGTEKSCKITVKNEPSKITISKSSWTMGTGESFTLSASVPDGSAAAVRTYRTSNSSVIKMTKTDWTGAFTAVNPGVAWVTVRAYNGVESSCKITVKDEPSKVSLSKSSVTLGLGEEFTLTSSVPTGTAAGVRTYSSDNTNAVTVKEVSGKGMLKASGKGTANVKVKIYNGKEAGCRVTVKNAPTSVNISKKSLVMSVGDTYTLSASLPEGEGCAKRTFRTSNSNIIKMTKTDWTGSFKAVSPGVAWVTVRTYNGKEANCKISVVTDEWKQVYQDLIDNMVKTDKVFDSGHTSYLLHDMDNDGIPELFISSTKNTNASYKTRTFNRIYTCVNEKAVLLHDTSDIKECGICQNKPYVVLQGFVQVHATTVMQKKGIQLNTVFSAYDTDGNYSKITGEKPVYSINNKTCSKSSYNYRIKTYLDMKKWYPTVDGSPVSTPIKFSKVR